MTEKKSKTNSKRLPKGQRKYIRRMKQAARKDAGILNNPLSRPAQPVRVHEKQENPKEVN